MRAKRITILGGLLVAALAMGATADSAQAGNRYRSSGCGVKAYSHSYSRSYHHGGYRSQHRSHRYYAPRSYRSYRSYGHHGYSRGYDCRPRHSSFNLGFSVGF